MCSTLGDVEHVYVFYIGMIVISNIGMHIYKNNFHLFKNIETVKKTELVRNFKRKF